MDTMSALARRCLAGWFVPAAVLGLVLIGAAPGHAEAVARRFVPAFDTAAHVRPPLARYPDGSSGTLLVDEAWQRGVAARKQAIAERRWPGPVAAPGDITRIGEVIVIEGDERTVGQDMGGRFGVGTEQLQEIAKKVIGFAGDVFDGITVWMTFNDSSSNALAFAFNVKNDVQGLGPLLPVLDRSGTFGSRGVLKVVVNMIAVGLTAGDSRETWSDELETWGQETGHRWSAFMRARYRGQTSSDILLGRDCAHYHSFVDSQASVHDGVAWRDNGDGSFTLLERNKRFGELDLYGMGLLYPDEFKSFFVIDDIPSYQKPQCGNYPGVRLPNRVTGKRYDISLDDIVAANGARVPATESGYVREAQVVVTRPGESGQGRVAVALAERIDRARPWWEEWARTATRNRLLVCTRTTADCGDARSDVVGIEANRDGIAPAQAPVPVDVLLGNTGAQAATGITTWAELAVNGSVSSSGPPRPAADLAPGQTRAERFTFDLAQVPCGSEAIITAWTQSDHHYHRARVTAPIGVEARINEGFESDSGWTVDPDGTDTGQGATWQRGQPREDNLFETTRVQPEGARSGQFAFATGLLPDSDQATGYVHSGMATLRSPLYPAAGLREPTLRYWVSFAGVRAGAGGVLESSDQSSLTVLVRSVAAGAGDGGVGASPWIEIERLSALITDGWQPRAVKLPATLDLSGQLQFQFVAADMNEKAGGVEAALDDIVVTSNLAGCYSLSVVDDGGDDGCGCRVGGRPSRPGALSWLLLAIAVASLRRRRY